MPGHPIEFVRVLGCVEPFERLRRLDQSVMADQMMAGPPVETVPDKEIMDMERASATDTKTPQKKARK